jgi:SAM-dependent methyltransferase
MSTSGFDFEGLFDQDYLYFYGPQMAPERTEAEVNLIWQLLDLKPGKQLLDLACGHGRISNRLAQRGCTMTGLDATDLFLQQAQSDAAEQGLEVEYLKGDMRSLPWTENFDSVVNWFTAYGYFSDEENRQVLREVYRSLKPGGTFLLDHLNRDQVLKHFQLALITEREGNYLIDRNRYNVLTGCTENERIIVREGRVRKLQFFVRLFSYTELRDWLLQAGFERVEGYGHTGEALTLDSRRMILVAHK